MGYKVYLTIILYAKYMNDIIWVEHVVRESSSVETLIVIFDIRVFL